MNRRQDLQITVLACQSVYVLRGLVFINAKSYRNEVSGRRRRQEVRIDRLRIPFEASMCVVHVSQGRSIRYCMSPKVSWFVFISSSVCRNEVVQGGRTYGTTVYARQPRPIDSRNAFCPKQSRFVLISANA